MARPLVCVVFYYLVFIILIADSTAWTFLLRQSDIDSPPIEPAESYSHQTRAKRSIIQPNDEIVVSPDMVAAGYLLADSTDQRLNLSDPIDRNLSMILDRVGPDMRPSRDYHDFSDISMDISKRAWTLMREHARVAIGNRISLAWRTIELLLHKARVSNECFEAISATFLGAERLESWAVKLLNSWGSFPMSGIFEGTYGDVGAFFTCVNIERNRIIDHAHYCSITYRPVMKSPKDYDLIVRKEPQELRTLFEDRKASKILTSNLNNTWDPTLEEKTRRDVMTDLLDHAQYHHFVYYKWGTCWPIACNPFDVRRVVKLVGRKNILMNGPVKCYSKFREDYEQEFEVLDEVLSGNVSSNGNTTAPTKRKLVISAWDKNGGIFIWKPHFSDAQKVAAGILIVLSIFIFGMTLIDLCYNKIPWLCGKLLLALKGLPLTSHGPNGNTMAVTFGSSIASSAGKFSHCAGGGPASMSPGAVRKHPSQAGFQMVPPNEMTACSDSDEQPSSLSLEPERAKSFLMSMVDDCSIFSNFQQFFRVSENQLKSDILCLHGIRCITMVWIILTHTMAYNDWSAFARTREVEIALNSLISQPLFNGSYLVDTFFLMSGLLSALTAFKHCQGLAAKFNSFAYIFGRWLRLTPQIFIMSMVYIVLPSWSHGPHWHSMVGEYSENCVNNWWINVLHLQAFYKTEEMCNFVTWWISIDFFYHFFALAMIWVILRAGHKWGFWSIVVLVASQIAWQSKRHYELALPPNVLSTIPQTGAMWTTMTLDFYWTPYAHSVPFFFGFYIGYLMALKTKVIKMHLNTRRALIGWVLAISLLLGQQYSTYWWVTGKAGYSKLVSTLFFGACSLIWNGSICWIIIACQHGYGGFINRVLSWKVFIVLGKASYLIYLSHFQVLFMFFGNQALLIEPSMVTMSYIIVGNIFVATIYGIILCSVYEIPWLRAHRRLMKYI